MASVLKVTPGQNVSHTIDGINLQKLTFQFLIFGTVNGQSLNPSHHPYLGGIFATETTPFNPEKVAVSMDFVDADGTETTICNSMPLSTLARISDFTGEGYLFAGGLGYYDAQLMSQLKVTPFLNFNSAPAAGDVHKFQVHFDVDFGGLMLKNGRALKISVNFNDNFFHPQVNTTKSYLQISATESRLAGSYIPCFKHYNLSSTDSAFQTGYNFGSDVQRLYILTFLRSENVFQFLTLGTGYEKEFVKSVNIRSDGFSDTYNTVELSAKQNGLLGLTANINRHYNYELYNDENLDGVIVKLGLDTALLTSSQVVSTVASVHMKTNEALQKQVFAYNSSFM